MTSPASTRLGDSKWVGLPSSKSSAKCSRYLFMGALLGALRFGGMRSITREGRPPFHVQVVSGWAWARLQRPGPSGLGRLLARGGAVAAHGHSLRRSQLVLQPGCP